MICWWSYGLHTGNITTSTTVLVSESVEDVTEIKKEKHQLRVSMFSSECALCFILNESKNHINIINSYYQRQFQCRKKAGKSRATAAAVMVTVGMWAYRSCNEAHAHPLLTKPVCLNGLHHGI